MSLFDVSEYGEVMIRDFGSQNAAQANQQKKVPGYMQPNAAKPPSVVNNQASKVHEMLQQ